MPEQIEPQQLFAIYKQAYADAGVGLDDEWSTLEAPERQAFEAMAAFVNRGRNEENESQ